MLAVSCKSCYYCLAKTWRQKLHEPSFKERRESVRREAVGGLSPSHSNSLRSLFFGDKKMPYGDKKRQREFQLNWVTVRKRKYLEQLGCCFFCGSHDDIQIHHVNPKEKESHKIWSWSDDRIELEMRKCVAMCEDCHVKFHRLLKRKSVNHGTPYGYRIGCRCADCTMASSAVKTEAKRKSRLKAKDTKTMSLFG